MEIKFQSTGSSSNFKTWLEGFIKISNSLLIEIDTTNQQFVAKVFSLGHDIVEYGKIDFSEAGFEVIAVKNNQQQEITIDEWNAENSENKRIYFPILGQLGRFIKVMNLFMGSNNYKLNISFSEYEDMLLASKAEFKSMVLTMNVRSSELTEFEEIIKKVSDDNFFNNVAAIKNPMKFSVTPEALKMFIAASGVFSEKAEKDVLLFQTKKEGESWALYAYDYNNNVYNYNFGYLSESCENPVEVNLPIVRDNFLKSVNTDDMLVITLDAIEGQNGNKVRLDSGTLFTTIIAAVVTGS